MEAGKIWVGPADDTILRKRGVEFVDGSAPGFAAIVGAPRSGNRQDDRGRLPEASLYIFCAANHNGTTVIEQLSRSRRADRLEHPYRALRSGHLPPSSPWALPTGPPWPLAACSPVTTKRCCCTTRTAFCLCQRFGRCGHRMGCGRSRLRQLGLPHPGRHRHSRNSAHGYLYLRARGGQCAPR
jgi:hypothetical protein